MHLSTYLELLDKAERCLATSYRVVGQGHAAEADLPTTCELLATQCDQHITLLAPVLLRYDTTTLDRPERLHPQPITHTRSGGVGLLRDLQDLYTLASFVDLTWTVVGQAARGHRDADLRDVAATCEHDTTTQLAWLKTRVKATAPQALLIDPPIRT